MARCKLEAWFSVACALLAASCVTKHDAAPAPPSASAALSPAPSASARQCDPAPSYTPDAPESERDEILSLTAFSVALRSWDDAADAQGSGIAAILADESGRVLCWSRQETHFTHNKTAHAEVRLIQNYLENSGHFDAAGLAIYVTLEPCAMCAGMIAMAHLKKAIYGSRAGASGGVFERLQLDSTAIGGYCPYRFSVASGLAPGPIGVELQRGSDPAKAPGDGEWRRPVLARAEARLKSFQPRYPENERVVRSALEFLEQVPRGYVAAPYRQACPPRGVTFALDDPGPGRFWRGGAKRPRPQELPKTGP